MTLWFILAGLVPWLLVFGAAVYLIHLWKKPGPDQLHRAEVDQLREEVSLMRDFIRDAMQRIARLEDERGGERRLGPAEGGGEEPPELPGSTSERRAPE